MSIATSVHRRSAIRTIEKPHDFLKKNGVLFEINRRLLHAYGLHMDCTSEGRLILEDHRENPVDLYSPIEFIANQKALENFHRDHGASRVLREKLLGFLIQEGVVSKKNS